MGNVVAIRKRLGQGHSTDTWRNMGEEYTLIAIRTAKGEKFGFHMDLEYRDFLRKIDELTDEGDSFRVTFHQCGRGFVYEG